MDADAGTPDWIKAVDIDEGLREFPDEDVLVLLHRKRVEVKKSGDREVKEHLVVHVRKPRRDRTVSYHSYSHAYRKQERFEGLCIDRSGRSRSFTPVILQGTGSEVHDGRLHVVVVNELQSGDLAAFELEYIERSPRSVSDRFPLYGEYPTLRMEYEVNIPGGWEGRVVRIPDGGADPESVRVAGGSARCILERIDKTERFPFQPENEVGFMAEFWDPSDSSESASWSDLVGWYQDLSELAIQDTAALRSLSREIAGESEGAEMVALLSRAVRDKVRYQQVYLGDGGYRPHPAMDVWRQAWGDCKDKGLLLVGLLRASGVNAYPVLVGAGWRSDPLVRGAGAFNHVIVAVESSDQDTGFRYIDPTANSVPLGRLPSMDEGARALLIGMQESPALFRLPRSTANDNRSEWHADFKIGSGGRITGRVRELHIGQRAFALRSVFTAATESERRGYLEQRATARACVVDSLSIAGLGADDDTLVMEYKIAVPEVVAKVQDGLLIWPNPLTGSVEPLFPEKEREVPIDFGYPFTYQTTARVRVPEGMTVQSLPESKDFETGAVSYHRAIALDGDRIEWRMQLAVSNPHIDETEYGALRSWDEARLAGDRTRVLLTKR